MKPHERIKTVPLSGLVLCASSLWFSGCSNESTAPRSDVRAAEGASAGVPGAGAASAEPDRLKAEEARLSALTNQIATAQQAQSEVVQRLLSRIEELEKRDGERSAALRAVQTASESQIKARENEIKSLATKETEWLRKVSELETKVASLQAGRVLPEITLPAEDAPTTRELDQKIRIAERNNELAAEAAAARAKEAPRLTAGPSGFGLSSADTNYVLRLRGLVQLDTRSFLHDNPLSEGNDTFLLRRVRPIVEGTAFRDIDFQFVPDFGGSAVQIVDANLTYRFRPELQLKAGKFKGPVGYENLLSDATLPFNERSFVTGLVPSRSLGVQLGGEALNGLLSYSAGVFNLGGDGRSAASSDFGDDKEVGGRVFVRPFKASQTTALQGFGFGVGGSYSQVSSNASGLPATTGGARPGYLTPGAQQFFAYNPLNGSTVVADGDQWRLSPHLSYTWGSFGLLGEYAVSHQSVLSALNNSPIRRRAGLDHQAWQLAVQWVLTGEPASFNGITPNRPFRPGSGGWGAWQLVGRFGQLEIDDDTFPSFANAANSASGATSWAVGINWWLNRNLRLLTSYSHTTFEGGGNFSPLDSSTFTPPATVSAQDENVVFTRMQLSF